MLEELIKELIANPELANKLKQAIGGKSSTEVEDSKVEEVASEEDPIPEPKVEEVKEEEEEVDSTPTEELLTDENEVDGEVGEELTSEIEDPIPEPNPIGLSLDDIKSTVPHDKLDKMLNILEVIKEKIADGFGELFLEIPKQTNIPEDEEKGEE